MYLYFYEEFIKVNLILLKITESKCIWERNVNIIGNISIILILLEMEEETNIK